MWSQHEGWEQQQHSTFADHWWTYLQKFKIFNVGVPVSGNKHMQKKSSTCEYVMGKSKCTQDSQPDNAQFLVPQLN